MKIKRTLTEVLDFPDDMPWEDAAELLVNGGEEEELVPADEVEEEDYEDEDA